MARARSFSAASMATAVILLDETGFFVIDLGQSTRCLFRGTSVRLSCRLRATSEGFSGGFRGGFEGAESLTDRCTGDHGKAKKGARRGRQQRPARSYRGSIATSVAGVGDFPERMAVLFGRG